MWCLLMSCVPYHDIDANDRKKSFLLCNCDMSAWFLIAEARMRNKAMKREALQAAREAKKERGN